MLPDMRAVTDCVRVYWRNAMKPVPMKPVPKKPVPKKPAPKFKAKKSAPKRQPPMRASAMRTIDALLDEALDETFPASDPVALTQPSRRRRAELKQRVRATI
jgi:hypothetical protein